VNKPYQGLRIAALASDQDGCGHYRIINPLHYVGSLGAQTKVFHKLEYDDLKPYDIVILQRQTNPFAVQLVQALKREGKTVIAETDDLLDRIPVGNPAYNAHKPGSVEHAVYREVIRACHGVTVSTPELRYWYLSDNRNTYVLPNYIDFGMREWPTPTYRNDGTVRIGWTGSMSHVVDMDILGRIVSEVLTKYDNVTYVHFGTDKLLHMLFERYHLPEDRVTHIPSVPFSKYPSELKAFDIGLAPLQVSAFALAKSHLKVLEYSACGIPFVASRVAPYVRYTHHGLDGFVAHSTNEWVDYISYLVENPEKRLEMAKAAYENAQSYDLGKNIDYYVQAWTSIRFAHLTGDVGPGPSLIPKKIGRNDPCPCNSGVKYKKCCAPAYGG
jgi:glycosyltransferase involved in cell wall biosynthesis